MTQYPIPHGVRTPCADDPDSFFPEKHATLRIEAAKAVCRPCPYRDGCASWAISRGELGVWGATDDKQREDFRKANRITAERAPSPFPRTHLARDLVPHGTPVGVEKHLKRYEPLCPQCEAFDADRRAGRIACGDCGTEMLPESLRRHQRRSCRERSVAS